jgi:hypothetical protein
VDLEAEQKILLIELIDPACDIRTSAFRSKAAQLRAAEFYLIDRARLEDAKFRDPDSIEPALWRGRRR